MELIMMLVMVARIRVMMGIATFEHLAKFLMGTNAIVMIMELISNHEGAWCLVEWQEIFD